MYGSLLLQWALCDLWFVWFCVICVILWFSDLCDLCDLCDFVWFMWFCVICVICEWWFVWFSDLCDLWSQTVQVQMYRYLCTLYEVSYRKATKHRHIAYRRGTKVKRDYLWLHWSDHLLSSSISNILRIFLYATLILLNALPAFTSPKFLSGWKRIAIA